MTEILKQPGIYKITCQSNGRFYIGSSSNCYRRWVEHRSELRNNNHGSIRLQKSFNKYGLDDFVFEVLEYLRGDIPPIELRSKEQEYLDKTKAYDKNIGFNMSDNAFCSHFEITDEQRQKWSESGKRVWNELSPEEYKRRVEKFRSVAPDNKGRKKSDEFKKKRSEYMKKELSNPDGKYAEAKKEWLRKTIERNKKGLTKEQREKATYSILAFYKTEEGQRVKEEMSRNKKEFFKTEKGLEVAKKSSERVKKYYETNKHHFLGKPVSEERKKKISESNCKFIYIRSDGEKFNSLQECADAIGVTIQAINYCIKNSAVCQGKFTFKKVNKNEVLGV